MLKLVIAASCLCAAVAEALASDLSGREINDLLAAGANVEIDTPVGTKLPVRYGRDGKLSGDAGGLAWYLGAATDHGKWWVDADQLCHRWATWFSSETQCLRLRKEGRIIRWRTADGDSGTATITTPAVKHIEAGLSDALPSRTKEAYLDEGAYVRDKAPKVPSAATAGAEPSPPVLKEPAPKDAAPTEDAAPKEAPEEWKQAAKDSLAPPPPSLPPPELAAPEKTPPPEAKAEPKPPRRTVERVYKVANVRIDDVLNIRGGPSADFDIVGALPPGSHGIVITGACRSQWCPVEHLVASGWVNSAYLVPEVAPGEAAPPDLSIHDAPDAPRSCLTAAVRSLLDRIERQFGPVQVVSTCRPGAIIPGTWRPSRHASGNAVDFKAGSRKSAIVAWLIANHHSGGIMTYRDMDHIHVDIGPRFVSIVGGPHWASWRDGEAYFRGPQ